MVSAVGINLIKKWESCVLTAYDDGTGVWTIGWGHTSGVTQGMSITQEQADAMLAEDLVIYNNAVRAYDAQYHWTQNEEDALTSFAFNLGTGSISQVTANGTRTKEQIAAKMLEYVNAGGKPLEGLRNRRREEAALFRETGTVDPDDPSTSPDGSEFFPKYDEWDIKIDQILGAIGATDYYQDAPGWRKREPIALANGINYKGLSEQNRQMCVLAKMGMLRKPK